MQVGGSGGLSNEINVVPMIDVLLVLLIIFMAALPTMRKAIDVQLPDPTPSVAPANAKSDQIVLEVNPNGEYFLNSRKMGHADLDRELHKAFDGRPDKIIFLKGSPDVKYEAVIDAMDIIRGVEDPVDKRHMLIGVPPKDLGLAPGKATPVKK